MILRHSRTVRSLCRLFLCFLFTAIAGRSFGADTEPFAGVDDRWSRYESPHFELFSQAGEAESRQILHRLELVRAVFDNQAQALEARPNPVTVYLFADGEAFRAYLPPTLQGPQRLSGFYLNRPDRSVIVMSPVWDAKGAQRLIFHEYIHHLSRVSGDTPATWFDEGIAEYFSTIEEDGDHLSLGLPILEHLTYLRRVHLMPLADLFAVDHASAAYNESERAGLFYAQSWLLLHYWFCGREPMTTAQRAARERFFNFVRAEGGQGSSADREKLFTECMGMSYDEAVRELETYVQGGNYTASRMPIPDIDAAESYAAAPLSKNQITVLLAELQLRVVRSPAAKKILVEASTGYRRDLRALEVLGTDAVADGDMNTARELWEQAFAAGSTNASVLNELASLQTNDWFNRLDVDFRLPPPNANRLRSVLLRSIENAPGQTKAYELLAWVEAVAKDPMPANINLVQQHLSSLRPRDRTLLALAFTRARFGDFANARLMLDRAEHDATVPQALRWSRVLREYVSRREAIAPRKS